MTDRIFSLFLVLLMVLAMGASCGGVEPVGDESMDPTMTAPAKPQPAKPSVPDASASSFAGPEIIGPTDSGTQSQPQPDAGVDAGQPLVDAGRPVDPVDAGQPVVDAGSQPFDAGMPIVDAGTPPPPVDAGTVCTPGTAGCPCAYSGNGVWSCDPGNEVGNPVVCDLKAGKCTNCGYDNGPCCEGPSGRTCNSGSSACLHHVAQVYQCHASFTCNDWGTGSIGKPCFSGGCCGSLTCAGTCY